MKKIKVHFLNWEAYDVSIPGSSNDNIFLWLLKKNFDVVMDSQNPDVLFYSLGMDNPHIHYKNCLKIYVNSEPGHYNNLEIYPRNERNFLSISDCDYMISSYKSNIDKNFYMPVFLIWLYHHINVTKIIPSFDYLTKYREINKKDKFCIFLHTNNTPHKRNVIFNKLNEYQTVDTKETFPIPYGSLHKINSIKNFKFSFAMQNHFYKEHQTYNIEGLIDEKIIESFLSNTVPIYYGNEKIDEVFNKNSFLNYHNYNDDDLFIEAIKEIDSNNFLLNEMLRQPIIKNIDDLGINLLEEFLLKIIK